MLRVSSASTGGVGSLCPTRQEQEHVRPTPGVFEVSPARRHPAPWESRQLEDSLAQIPGRLSPCTL